MRNLTFILIYCIVATTWHRSVALRRIKRDETDVLNKNNTQIEEDFVKVVNLPNRMESEKSDLKKSSSIPKMKLIGMYARKMTLPRLRSPDNNEENDHEKGSSSENQQSNEDAMNSDRLNRANSTNKLYRIGDLEEFKLTNPPAVAVTTAKTVTSVNIKKSNKAALDYLGQIGIMGDREQRRATERILETSSTKRVVDENGPKVVIIKSRLQVPEMAAIAMAENNMGHKYQHANQRKLPITCQSQKVAAMRAKIASNQNNNVDNMKLLDNINSNNYEYDNSNQNIHNSNYIVGNSNGNTNRAAPAISPSVSVSAINAPVSATDNQQQKQQQMHQQQAQTQQQPLQQLQKKQQQQKLTQQQQNQQKAQQHQQIQQQQSQLQQQLQRQQDREQQKQQVPQLPFVRPNIKLSPMENVLKFANMLLYNVGLDGVRVPTYHGPVPQITIKPNANSLVRMNSGTEGDDFDAIDYFYNTMEPGRMDGVTGTAPVATAVASANRPASLTSYSHPFFMQSQFVPVNEPPQPFNFIESALDMLLAGDGGSPLIEGGALDDLTGEAEFNCPIHQEKKEETPNGSCGAIDKPNSEIAMAENGGGGGADDKDGMMVCSCRIYKKKKNALKVNGEPEQPRCGN